MIDEKHQGKGYGKAALKELIQMMSQSHCTRIMIGHRPISEEVIEGEIIRLLQIV